MSETGTVNVNEPMLSIRNLRAWYGESQALHNVDLDVRAGEILTLVGRNGAGKSTILRSIIGIVPKRAGSIAFKRRETIAMPSKSIARLGIGYIPEERGIYSTLTVAENLMLPPTIASGGLTVEEIFALFPNLKERLSNQGTKLSGGEQQMLAIGRVLRTGSRLLLLDEPTEGLAPVIIEQIGRTILQLKTRGFTVVLVEQNVAFAVPLSDRFYVVEEGRIVDDIVRTESISADVGKLQSYVGV